MQPLVGPVNGSLTSSEALENMLRSEGLRYWLANERTVAIVKESRRPASAGSIVLAQASLGLTEQRESAAVSGGRFGIRHRRNNRDSDPAVAVDIEGGDEYHARSRRPRWMHAVSGVWPT